MTSLDLLLSSEAGPEVVRTLRALLAGEMSGALRDHEEWLEDTKRVLECRKICGWAVYKASAVRRDGLSVTSHGLSDSQVEPLRFCATFPSRPGAPAPLLVLRAITLAAATDEADRRWPLADWWLRIDAEGSR